MTERNEGDATSEPAVEWMGAGLEITHEPWQRLARLPLLTHEELTVLHFAIVARLGAHYVYVPDPLPDLTHEAVGVLHSLDTAVLEARAAVKP